jgi:hypothetical protein
MKNIACQNHKCFFKENSLRPRKKFEMWKLIFLEESLFWALGTNFPAKFYLFSRDK